MDQVNTQEEHTNSRQKLVIRMSVFEEHIIPDTETNHLDVSLKNLKFLDKKTSHSDGCI